MKRGYSFRRGAVAATLSILLLAVSFNAAAAPPSSGRSASWTRLLKAVSDGAMGVVRTAGKLLSRRVRVPTDVGKIVRMRRDPVLRNLLITQRYYDISKAFSKVLGRRNTNWFTFAVWASKTAGESIRGEASAVDVAAMLSGIIGSRLAKLAAPVAEKVFGLLRPALRKAIDQVGEYISAGNLKVFAELAPVAIRFLKMARSLSRPKPAALDAFLGALSSRQDGLGKAFTAYYNALFQRNRDKKARLIHLANGLIGLHEQTRLQPEIEKAIEAPFDAYIAPALKRVSFLPEIKIGRFSLPSVKDLSRRLRKTFREAATKMMAGMQLPGGGRLRLTRDLEPDKRGGAFLPSPLRLIAEPAALVAFLRRYDRVPGNTGRGTAATDWADLGDRMNFIINLFQSRQQAGSLFRAPFSSRQRRLINRRVRPPGML